MKPSNYHTPNTPQPGNFRRVFSDCFFKADDDTLSGELRLGSVTTTSYKHGNTEVEVMVATKSGLQRGDMSTSEVKPEFEVTTNEYTPDLVAVSLFGDFSDDLVLAGGANQVLNLDAVHPRRAYRLGKRLVSGVVVTSGGAEMQEDLDYTLDADKGYVTVMDGGGIEDGAPLTIHYDCEEVTLRKVLPYTRLNRKGFMRLYSDDDKDRNPREEKYFKCHLNFLFSWS